MPTKAVTDASFQSDVLDSSTPVLVDFWADWCGPCHMMAPSFEAAARELEPRMRFIKLDTEAEPQVAARYDIRGIPNLIVFSKGRVHNLTTAANLWLAAVIGIACGAGQWPLVAVCAIVSLVMITVVRLAEKKFEGRHEPGSPGEREAPEP